MKSQTINQLKTGVVLSYLQMAISIIIGIIYTPFMIKVLGRSEYGLYNTVTSTISLISILSLGFNSGYIRYFSKYKKSNDLDSISKLNGLFMIIFLILGGIALLCGIFLSFNLNLVFQEGLTSSEYEIGKILMLLLTINLAVSFPASVFTTIISANERFVYLKIINLLRTIIGPLITLPILLSGYGSIQMVIVIVCVSLVADFSYMLYVIFKLKNRFIFRGFEKGIFRDIFIFTSFIAINIVVDQVNWNVDKILLGRFLGTSAVAVYSIGALLFSFYMTISTTISSVFTPRVHAIVQNTKNDLNEQRTQLTNLFIRIGRIQFLILVLIASGYVFFGMPFIINFWAGPGYEDSYYVALILIVPAIIPFIQNIGTEIQRAQNNHKFRSILYALMALMNFGLSIYLIQVMGPIGAAIGTGIAYILANGLVMNIYYHKKCNIDIISFWKSILRLSLVLLLPVIVGIVLVLYLNQENIWLFILSIVLYSLIYILSAWFIGMNDYEKDLIRVPLKRIFAKKNNNLK